jgi:hypothetical protein
MKKLLIILFCFLPFALTAQPYVYYVAPTGGSDDNAGTNIAAPWATWQKAFETADAGDTVYFRGGTWTPVSKASLTGVTIIDPLGGHGNNGTYANPICFFAYPPDFEAGNKPILDCINSGNADYGNIGLVVQNCTYIKFKGLTVLNNRMMNLLANSGGISASTFGHLHFENMTSGQNGGAGFWARTYDTVYFVNCDSYSNCDSLDATSPGGDGDGFASSSRGGTDGNDADTTRYTYITGCRAWNNSDDGFDIGSTKQVQFYNNWAFGNGGNSAEIHGDGVGLKFSFSAVAMTEKRRVYNNIFSYNISGDSAQGGGFSEVNLYDEEDFGPVAEIYNNTIYKNYGGLTSSNSWGWANYPTPYYKDIVTNNIVHEYDYAYPAVFKAVNYTQGDPSYVTLSTNTFYLNSIYGNCTPNPAFTLSDADFKALPTDRDNCIDILSASRQSDGSLPDIGDYFKLAVGSDLIGVGTDVGMSATPDLGVDWAYLESEAGGGDPETPEYPTALTTAVTIYNAKHATLGGNVISNGGGTLTARGLCYSTSENPTTSDNVIAFTPGEGSYSIKLTTLQSGTTYHVRAYATNETGTSYGQNRSFTTPAKSWIGGYRINGKPVYIK